MIHLIERGLQKMAIQLLGTLLVNPDHYPGLILRVFYVRVSKCEIDGSTPERLSVNHTLILFLK